MIVHLDGDHETVDYIADRSVLVYDNVENEEYPVHWHNAIEVIMPLANGFTAVCAGKEFVLQERDILIIPAGTLHTLRAQPGRRLIMLFDNRTIAENPALSDLSPALMEPLMITREDKELLSSLGTLLTDIYTLYSDFRELTEVHIYMKLLTLLTLITEMRLSKAGMQTDLKHGERFLSVLRYIDQNYASEIDLDELAALAGYSKFHFSRMFKKYCGTTFIAFLNHRRVRAAELLLMRSDISVTCAALQAGFSSLTTFNRVFKEIKGCTPSEFRKLYQNTNSY